MHPRSNALGILMRGNDILVECLEGPHSKGTGIYYRPIGGTIEYGEYSKQTIVRELQEELGVEVNIVRYIGCLENIFQVSGEIGHEITQLYIVEFANRSHYKIEHFEVMEACKSGVAKWVSIDDFIQGSKVIYPDGIVQFIINEKQ